MYIIGCSYLGLSQKTIFIVVEHFCNIFFNDFNSILFSILSVSSYLSFQQFPSFGLLIYFFHNFINISLLLFSLSFYPSCWWQFTQAPFLSIFFTFPFQIHIIGSFKYFGIYFSKILPLLIFLHIIFAFSFNLLFISITFSVLHDILRYFEPNFSFII